MLRSCVTGSPDVCATHPAEPACLLVRCQDRSRRWEAEIQKQEGGADSDTGLGGRCALSKSHYAGVI